MLRTMPGTEPPEILVCYVKMSHRALCECLTESFTKASLEAGVENYSLVFFFSSLPLKAAIFLS